MRHKRRSGYTPPGPRLSDPEIRYYQLSEKLIGDVSTRPHLWLDADVAEHYSLTTLLGKMRGLDLAGHRDWLIFQWEEYALFCEDESECSTCGNYMSPDGACEHCERGHWSYG